MISFNQINNNIDNKSTSMPTIFELHQYYNKHKNLDKYKDYKPNNENTVLNEIETLCIDAIKAGKYDVDITKEYLKSNIDERDLDEWLNNNDISAYIDQGCTISFFPYQDDSDF